MIRLTLAALVAASLSSQNPAGYAAALHALPNGAGSTLVLPNDELVWFTGTDLVAQAHGQQPRTLLHFASPVFASFTAVADANHLLFAESSNQELWSVPLHGGTPQVLGNLPFAYDPVAFASGQMLISAKVGGFGTSDNDIVLLDVHTGAMQTVAQVPGASGPLEVDAHGDVWYATASLSFPTPPGTALVVRWRRADVDAAIASHTVLGIAQAQTMASGLDSASDIAFDSDGDLLFVDWFNNQVGELDDVHAGSPHRSVLLDYAAASVSPASLQFVGTGAGQFEPFAPVAPHRLFVQEGTFGGTSQLRALRTQRAQSAVHPTPIPAGPFAITTQDAPANAIGLLAISGVVVPGESLLAIPGFEQLLPWNAGMHSAVNTHLLTFDGQGSAQLNLLNPGFPLGLTGRAQCAFFDPQHNVIGSAATVDLHLGN
jgi:hypothetical protein